MPDTGRKSYDTGASQQVQGDIGAVAARLETVINDRDKAVQQALADFQADGVSDQYATVERRWNSAASEVKSIITLVRDTLSKNDDTASTTLAQAKSAVSGIG
jgi:uncharacterized protein YukE